MKHGKGNEHAPIRLYTRNGLPVQWCNDCVNLRVNIFVQCGNALLAEFFGSLVMYRHPTGLKVMQPTT